LKNGKEFKVINKNKLKLLFKEIMKLKLPMKQKSKKSPKNIKINLPPVVMTLLITFLEINNLKNNSTLQSHKIILNNNTIMMLFASLWVPKKSLLLKSNNKMTIKKMKLTDFVNNSLHSLTPTIHQTHKPEIYK
jgi:hypothetical protein